jgi:hypothetical protein
MREGHRALPELRVKGELFCLSVERKVLQKRREDQWKASKGELVAHFPGDRPFLPTRCVAKTLHTLQSVTMRFLFSMYRIRGVFVNLS